MNADSQTVSVVIPCKNAAPFIAATLESVFAQTLLPGEVILVDDESADESVATAMAFGDRVRIVSQKSAGVSVARNRGVREATGSLIAFLDADDLWRPGKLERQVAYLQAHPDMGAVITSVGKFVESPDTTFPHLRVTDEQLRSSAPIDFLIACWGHPSSLMVRTQLAIAAPYPEGIRDSEDMIQATALRLLAPVGAVPDELTLYRRHANQTTQDERHRSRSLEARVRWARDHHRILGADGPDDAIVPILDDRIRAIEPLYWRRRIKQFRRERNVVRALWPKARPMPRILRCFLAPAPVLRLKDLVGRILAGRGGLSGRISR